MIFPLQQGYFSTICIYKEYIYRDVTVNNHLIELNIDLLSDI